MSSVCINCNKVIPAGNEFCNECMKELDEMVDAKELEQTKQKVDMTQNVNPFFSSSSPTGSISDNEDTIERRIEQEKRKDDTSGFWLAILLVALILFLMITVYLGVPSL